jgi:hypothetical protein
MGMFLNKNTSLFNQNNSTRGLNTVTADSKRQHSTPVRYDWLRAFRICLPKALPTLRKSWLNTLTRN